MTEFGKVYRDEVSGFVGTAIGRAEYWHGATSVQLEAKTGPSGDQKLRWVPEGRLEEVEPRGSGFGLPDPL